jgi:lipoate-protein ligase A
MNGIFRGDVMGQSTYKVPGGKMLKIQLQISEEKIKQVTIMGDFFLHPEETVLTLERKLQGLKPDPIILTEAIQKVLDENNALLIGAKPEDIAKAIEMAK